LNGVHTKLISSYLLNKLAIVRTSKILMWLGEINFVACRGVGGVECGVVEVLMCRGVSGPGGINV
jgi:hypothetical protein